MVTLMLQAQRAAASACTEGPSSLSTHYSLTVHSLSTHCSLTTISIAILSLLLVSLSAHYWGAEINRDRLLDDGGRRLMHSQLMPSSCPAHAQLLCRFRLFDQDGNGRISKYEFRYRFASKIGNPPHYSLFTYYSLTIYSLLVQLRS